MTENKIERLLEKILAKLDILAKKETIPQISQTKNLSFLFDIVNANWTSFKPLQLNNMRLFGYHYNSAPSPVLTELEEGWIPLRITNNSELQVYNTDLLAKNTEIDAVLDTIKTVVDAIQAQTDKLTFTGTNNVLSVHELAPT